jgi:phenylpyruvate tautomerase PptA (4-oxalocrotonate tautomerase family)
MAKSAAAKGKSSDGKANGANAATPESLDQVRDILFGGQMRMVDARLQGLEERLLHEQSALRTEMGRRFSEIESTMKKDLASLNERLAAERAKRAEDLKALGSDLRETLRNLERRHQKLEEAAAAADADLRDQLVKSTTTLSAEFTRTGDRLSAELARLEASLRSEKLDTAALAAALTEMAAKLAGTNRSAGKGAARD